MAGTLVKKASYHYDPTGRRIFKDVVDNQAPSDPKKTFQRRMVYDGQEMLLEFGAGNSLLARYTHSGLATDDALAVDVSSAGAAAALAQSAGSYVYLKDHQGTIRDVLDSAGNLIQHYVYSAFGILLGIQDANAADISDNPRITTSFTYTGREFDSESGLYYYRARYYDPGIGRFLQRDPDPGKLVNPLSVINKYAYALNNPINFTDPTGMSVWTDIRDGLWAFVAAAAVIFTAGAAAAIIGGAGWAGVGTALAQAVISTTMAATLTLGSSIALAAGQSLATGEWGGSFWSRVGSAFRRSAFVSAGILGALGIGASLGLGGGFGPIRLGFSTQTDILGRGGIQLGPVTGLFGQNSITHELGHFFLQYAPLQFLGGLASPHGNNSGFFWGAGIYGAAGIAGWYYPWLTETWLPSP